LKSSHLVRVSLTNQETSVTPVKADQIDFKAVTVVCLSVLSLSYSETTILNTGINTHRPCEHHGVKNVLSAFDKFSVVGTLPHVVGKIKVHHTTVNDTFVFLSSNDTSAISLKLIEGVNENTFGHTEGRLKH